MPKNEVSECPRNPRQGGPCKGTYGVVPAPGIGVPNPISIPLGVTDDQFYVSTCLAHGDRLLSQTLAHILL